MLDGILERVRASAVDEAPRPGRSRDAVAAAAGVRLRELPMTRVWAAPQS